MIDPSGVHAPPPDAVAARMPELRAALPGQERAHEDQRPADLPEQLGIGAGAAQRARAQSHGVAIAPRDIHPQARHHREQGAHVVDVGEIPERDGLGGEQRRRHRGERGVLVSPWADLTLGAGAPFDHELGHGALRADP